MPLANKASEAPSTTPNHVATAASAVLTRSCREFKVRSDQLTETKLLNFHHSPKPPVHAKLVHVSGRSPFAHSFRWRLYLDAHSKGSACRRVCRRTHHD